MGKIMSLENDFNIIMEYTHLWNWSPDWGIVKEIYKNNPNSYSVLMPFAYTYLEEIIRSTTSEYELPLYDNNDKPIKIKVGMALINLAMEENKTNKEYINILERIKDYFDKNKLYSGNGRNKTLHGHLHPRFWYKEDFDNLIHNIAIISPYSKF